MGFHVWEREQLEKMVNGAIKGTKAQIKQFEAANQTDQLRSAKREIESVFRVIKKDSCFVAKELTFSGLLNI